MIIQHFSGFLTLRRLYHTGWKGILRWNKTQNNFFLLLLVTFYHISSKYTAIHLIQAMFKFMKRKNITITLDITSGGKRLLLFFCSFWGLIKPNKIQEKIIIQHCILHPNIAKLNIKNGKLFVFVFPHKQKTRKKKYPSKGIKKKKESYSPRMLTALEYKL